MKYVNIGELIAVKKHDGTHSLHKIIDVHHAGQVHFVNPIKGTTLAVHPTHVYRLGKHDHTGKYIHYWTHHHLVKPSTLVNLHHIKVPGHAKPLTSITTEASKKYAEHIMVPKVRKYI